MNMKFQIGLQPWTIRDELDQDYLGSLAKVSDIGYQGVEIGLLPDGMTMKQLKDGIASLNLTIISCHVGMEDLIERKEALLIYLQQLAIPYVVLSYYKFESEAHVLQTAQKLNEIGQFFKQAGIQFLYHNHDMEFIKFNHEYALDILLRETDPGFVKMELDTYWVKKGGEDPVSYLKKLQDRCPLLHIKDMAPGEEQFFAEIGEGILDFRDIIKVAEQVGTEWLIVEQDECRRSPFDCITTSFNNLNDMGVIK